MQRPTSSNPRSAFARLARLGVTLLALAATAIPAAATSRIKDIADFEGVRENQLVGYGLVVGLVGTGYDMNNMAPYTRESLIGML
jgi:flagellar P-ring protein precursor FlgI